MIDYTVALQQHIVTYFACFVKDEKLRFLGFLLDDNETSSKP